MRKEVMFILAVIVFCSLSYAEYTSKDVIRETLKHYGLEVTDVGLTPEGAVIEYEQKPTTSPARILSDNTLAMVAIADEYPQTDMVFVITRIGGHPVLLTYAKTTDVLGYANGTLSGKDFATRIYGKILVPQKSSDCCGSALILIGSLLAVIIRY
ncbi:MAG: hypothetical protein QXF35_02080 [Candidatus Bilamarchaeaceae archaeon]